MTMLWLLVQKGALSRGKQAQAQRLKKGGGEMEKVCMRFATFANVVLHYILLQSGIIIELQYWPVFNIEEIYFLFLK